MDEGLERMDEFRDGCIKEDRGIENRRIKEYKRTTKTEGLRRTMA